MPIPHRKYNRLKAYDYSNPWWYFVTICTQNKVNWFGEILKGEMKLNKYGEIAKQQLMWLTKQYAYVELDEWVIMPNHVHMIIIINPNPAPSPYVGTGRDLSLHIKIKSLSELIGAFKTNSLKLIHRLRLSEFQWQRSFYDHIIRTEISCDKIRQYIRYNPLRWELDRNAEDKLEL